MASPPASPQHVRPASMISRPSRSFSRVSTGSAGNLASAAAPKGGPSIAPGAGVGAPNTGASGGAGVVASAGAAPGVATASRISDDDSKTAVKVAVRIRPPLRPEDPGFELIPQRFQRSTVHVTSPTSLSVDAPQGRKLFVFDRVFSEQTDQTGIWDYLADSVGSFVQGYNVSILAYGQSGAGKSYTMGTSGPREQEDGHARGIIPRAAQVLFERLNGPPPIHSRISSTGLRAPTRYSTSGIPSHGKSMMDDKNWQLKATYVEIYNEQLRDLLLPESTPASDRNNVTIREDAKGRILLAGLRAVDINSVDDLLAALNFGSSIRQTDATAINAKSSRSHAVFSLNLIQRKDGQLSKKEKRFSMPVDGLGESFSIDSKLHFVDLAGSERLKNTGASGERAKEGISINAGLASLGKVISQLSSRHPGSHVSYRDSKLTRLLQDSLGGNAITYMIACVTPAEFHLSETLNTVQYAQRARAIQSKPRIQQIADEGGKQAIIQRLKAEVSFLRQQIRGSDDKGGISASTSTTERPGQSSEREIELQNSLLDAQESYTALSQRHAKLISELSKASATDINPENPEEIQSMVGESATDRLKRSHSFAESVEQVVLEYEKTIQSLESSLSQTRSGMSAMESTLMERETKFAYLETVNSQLQARIQKIMDREVNTENYLHDLESKLDGQTSGEERNAGIISELRKEITRARENEAGCEDYISTLEERLAESDQDIELMQREIERLEHVIDRQRSLGKLDNLLYELDNIQQKDKRSRDMRAADAKTAEVVEEARRVSTPTTPTRRERARERGPSLSVLLEDGSTLHEGQAVNVNGTVDQETEEQQQSATIPDLGQPDEELEVAETKEIGELEPDGIEIDDERARAPTPRPASADYQQSPAQSRYVAEKLTDVTQELFDLRIQHESTVGDYDLLSAKYEEALRTLAELQDTIDEAKHASPPKRPDSIVIDTTVNDHENRLLSSELAQKNEDVLDPEQPSLKNGDLSPTPEKKSPLPDDEAGSHYSSAVGTPNGERSRSPVQHFDDMQQMLQEHQEKFNAVSKKYAELKSEHDLSLNLVEELKAEMRKIRTSSTSVSPVSASSSSSGPPSAAHNRVVRRMTSQSMSQMLSGVERVHRSLAGLRSIAEEQFDRARPEAMQSFDSNLDATMHELHVRMERIQTLETENKMIKEEMQQKATIISGLARERSSFQAPGGVMDISVMSSMHETVERQEAQIREMTVAHDERIKELRAEMASLNDLVESQKQTQQKLAGEVDEWQGKHNDAAAALSKAEKQLAATLHDLEAARTDRATWEERHGAATADLEQSQAELKRALGELEATLAVLESIRTNNYVDKDALTVENRNHDILVRDLQKQVEEHEATIATHTASIKTHVATIADLRQQLSGAEAKERVDVLSTPSAAQPEAQSKQEAAELSRQVDTLTAEVNAHQGVVAGLKGQIEEAKGAHAREAATLAQQVRNSETAHEAATAELEQLRIEVEQSRAKVTVLVDTVGVLLGAVAPLTAETVPGEIQRLMEERAQLSASYESLVAEHDMLRKQLEGETEPLQQQVSHLTAKAAQHEAKVSELAHLAAAHEEAIKQKDAVLMQKNHTIEEITNEKARSLRLVEELEDQITNTFDQHHNRLSTIQQERAHALEDANGRINALEKEIDGYRARIDMLEGHRANGAASPPIDIDRNSSLSSNLRKSASVASLPSSPPPAIPLPPLPSMTSPAASRHQSKELIPPSPSPTQQPSPQSSSIAAAVEDQEARIRTVEKHLHAEKQLTATLEEALGDLEAQSNKVKADMEAWKKKAWQYEDELVQLRNERNSARHSLQAVEEERSARREAEAARAHLEEKMNAISRKKKKSTLNCF